MYLSKIKLTDYIFPVGLLIVIASKWIFQFEWLDWAMYIILFVGFIVLRKSHIESDSDYGRIRYNTILILSFVSLLIYLIMFFKERID